MREHLAHLAWLRGQAVPAEAFAGVPGRKLRQFTAEARSRGAADLGRAMESKRLALKAAMLRGQVAQALDDAAEMCVRLMTRMHTRAREALDDHRAQHAVETDALVALRRETVLARQGQKVERDARLKVVDSLLLPDADAIQATCEAHAAFAGNNDLLLLARCYGGRRAAFLRFLEYAAPASTSQDHATEEAIAYLLAHRVDRRAKLRTAVDVVQPGGAAARQPLNLSWVGEIWWAAADRARGAWPAPAEVNRTAIFGLAHLLGVELMPRIRSWQDLHLLRPDAGARYEHIDGLFTATADWALIEAPGGCCRRPSCAGSPPAAEKNRLYFAYGKFVRTGFLLRYLSSIELRRAIGTATKDSELFNRYAQWVSFGSSGLATAAERDEQRKMVKYNLPIANLLICHTAVDMTRALDEIVAEGHSAAIIPEALAGTSPYLKEHLNRFGGYELALSNPPAPLPFDLPARLQPSHQGAATIPV